MMATTSFMITPSVFAKLWPSGERPTKSGIFLGKWHKKLAALSGKRFKRPHPSPPVQGSDGSATMSFGGTLGPVPSLGAEMSDRSWFVAANGQQQGPYPEARFRDFVARGMVTPDMLVWTEGMAGWQKAGEIPGLLSRAASAPTLAQSGGRPMNSAGVAPLSIDFGIWDFTWRSVVFFIGAVLVIPLPWVLVMYCKWMVSSTRVPRRPKLTFTARPLTILWWYLGAIVLFIFVGIFVGLTGIRILNALVFLVQFGLYWLAIKSFVANIASNGQPLGLG